MCGLRAAARVIDVAGPIRDQWRMADVSKPGGETALPGGRSSLGSRLARLTPPQIVILFIVLGALVRIPATSQFGLDFDGVYSTVIARQWAWSYFDHPPMHYWLVHLASSLLGTDAPWAVRIPYMLLHAGSTWLLFRIASRAFGEWAGVWAAAGFSVAAIFAAAYSHFVIPDGPLYFFSLLAAYLLLPALLAAPGEDVSAELRWMGAGLAGGCALLSKYSAVLFFLGLFIFLLTSKQQRHWFVRRAPWIAAVLCVAMFSPVVLWNWQNDWISFSFQGKRALPFADGGFKSLFESIGMQMFFLFPWIFVPMAAAFGKALIIGPRDQARWFFACLAACPILIFTLLNLMHRGLPHWTMPGWLFVFPLLGAEIVQTTSFWRKRAWHTAVWTAVILVTAIAVLVAEVRLGLYSRVSAWLFPSAQVDVRDPTFGLFEWDGLEALLRRNGLLDDSIKFIATIHWHHTARVGYVMGRQYPVICIDRDTRHFGLVHDLPAFRNASGLLIDLAGIVDGSAKLVDGRFERRGPRMLLDLSRGARPPLRLSVERVSGLKPMPQ